MTNVANEVIVAADSSLPQRSGPTYRYTIMDLTSIGAAA